MGQRRLFGPSGHVGVLLEVNYRQCPMDRSCVVQRMPRECSAGVVVGGNPVSAKVQDIGWRMLDGTAGNVGSG